MTATTLATRAGSRCPRRARRRRRHADRAPSTARCWSPRAVRRHVRRRRHPLPRLLSPARCSLNLFVDNAYLIVLAVGMTFVILTGGIDLSVGAVVALSTMIAAALLQSGLVARRGDPADPGDHLLLGLLVGLMIHVFKVQPFIATLAAMFLARGLCYVISNRSISITDPFFVALARPAIPLGRACPSRPSVDHRAGRRRGRRSGCCTAPASAAPSTPSAAASSRRC